MEQNNPTYTIITTKYHGHCLAENDSTHELVCLHEGCNLVSPERDSKIFAKRCLVPKGKMRVPTDCYHYARHPRVSIHGALNDLVDPHTSSDHLADSHFPHKR